MHLVHDILESLEGASWFGALDLWSGNCQGEMEEVSKEKTAFIATKVRSGHLYLYSAFNNTDCVKATLQ